MSNSPLASLAKQHGINFNPQGTKNMLSFAAKREPGAGAAATTEEAREEGNNGEVNTANFLSAKQVQANKRARQD